MRILLAALVLAGIGGCRPTPRDEAGMENLQPTSLKVEGKRTTHQIFFDRLAASANIGSDARFVRRIAEIRIEPAAVAPRGLRDLLLAWDESAFHAFGIWCRYDGQTISLTYRTRLRVTEEADAAELMLRKTFAAQGFKDSEGVLTAFPREEHRNLQRSNPHSLHTFRRAVEGGVEETVVDIQGGLTGGKFETDLEIYWTIATPYECKPPKFAELLACRPFFQPAKVPDDDRSLLDIVGQVPVFSSTSGFGRGTVRPRPNSGFNGEFPASVRPSLEKELARLGFELKATHPIPNGTTQFMWHRYSDDTYSNIITLKNKDRIRFDYELPRREPRSTVQLSQIKFQQPADARLFRHAHQISTRLAEPSWYVLPLGTWTKSKSHMAIWHSLSRRDNWMWSSPEYPNRPAGRRVHTISLEAHRSTAQATVNRSLQLKAKWCPPGAGWGVRFRLISGAQVDRVAFTGEFVNYDMDGEVPNDLRLAFPGQLNSYLVSKELGGTRYLISVGTGNNGRFSHKELSRLIATPEAFRDVSLEWLNQLGRAIEKNVRSGQAIRSAVLASSSGRAKPLKRLESSRLRITLVAEPPEKEPLPPPTPSRRELTDDEQDQIIREAESKLELRRKLLGENFREMHRALMRAFPLDELLPGGA